GNAAAQAAGMPAADRAARPRTPARASMAPPPDACASAFSRWLGPHAGRPAPSAGGRSPLGAGLLGLADGDILDLDRGRRVAVAIHAAVAVELGQLLGR